MWYHEKVSEDPYRIPYLRQKDIDGDMVINDVVLEHGPDIKHVDNQFRMTTKIKQHRSTPIIHEKGYYNGGRLSRIINNGDAIRNDLKRFFGYNTKNNAGGRNRQNKVGDRAQHIDQTGKRKVVRKEGTRVNHGYQQNKLDTMETGHDGGFSTTQKITAKQLKHHMAMQNHEVGHKESYMVDAATGRYKVVRQDRRTTQQTATKFGNSVYNRKLAQNRVEIDKRRQQTYLSQFVSGVYEVSAVARDKLLNVAQSGRTTKLNQINYEKNTNNQKRNKLYQNNVNRRNHMQVKDTSIDAREHLDNDMKFIKRLEQDVKQRWEHNNFASAHENDNFRKVRY